MHSTNKRSRKPARKVVYCPHKDPDTLAALCLPAETLVAKCPQANGSESVKDKCPEQNGSGKVVENLPQAFDRGHA